MVPAGCFCTFPTLLGQLDSFSHSDAPWGGPGLITAREPSLTWMFCSFITFSVVLKALKSGVGGVGSGGWWGWGGPGAGGGAGVKLPFLGA